MTELLVNNKIYHYESYWQDKKNKIIYDINDKKFPIPKNGLKWQNQELFIDKLKIVYKYLDNKKKFIGYKNKKNCLICGQKNITNKLYDINGIRWENGLIHYIIVHNIKPSDKFIDFIFRMQINLHKIYRQKNSKIKGKLKGKIVEKSGKQYLKLNRNQILIMDALMEHGGKKIYNEKNKNFKYSEHFGLLDFNDDGLEKVIISGNTNRIDEGDSDIFLPDDVEDAFDYEYIFHTHPPTPKAGGRANEGIIYEFPSINDIFHYIDHHNDGKTQGSIIIAPEGLYIIRKNKFNTRKIKVNEDKLFDELQEIYNNIHSNTIDKYGTNFSNSVFYTKIAQNNQYINEINELLHNYDLHIDYYSRKKNKVGKWIIDTVYLPVNVVERD